MISTDFREYDFYTYGDADGYGQPVLSKDVQGTIKIAIFPSGTAIQDNIAFKNASFVGLTHDSKVNDTYVIMYKNKRLKVLYVQSTGRFKQVYLGEM
jgi:hypothetical protein